jgi:hypothetical protein
MHTSRGGSVTPHSISYHTNACTRTPGTFLGLMAVAAINHERAFEWSNVHQINSYNAVELCQYEGLKNEVMRQLHRAADIHHQSLLPTIPNPPTSPGASSSGSSSSSTTTTTSPSTSTLTSSLSSASDSELPLTSPVVMGRQYSEPPTAHVSPSLPAPFGYNHNTSATRKYIRGLVADPEALSVSRGLLTTGLLYRRHQCRRLYRAAIRSFAQQWMNMDNIAASTPSPSSATLSASRSTSPIPTPFQLSPVVSDGLSQASITSATAATPSSPPSHHVTAASPSASTLSSSSSSNVIGLPEQGAPLMHRAATSSV